MEDFLHLPNGHLLNLQPRPRHGKRTKVGNELQTPRRVQESTPKPDEPLKSGSKDSTGASPDTAPRKKTPTKLPLPKSFTDKEKQQPKEQPGTSEQKGHRADRVLQPKRSFGALQRSTPKKTDSDRDQYWRKVKDRFEKDIPGTSFTREKPKEYYQEAYRKIVSLANSPRQEIAKQKQKLAGGAPRGDRTVLQGPSPPTKIPYSSNESRPSFGRSAREGGAGPSTGQRKRPIHGIQRTHLNFSNSTPAISSEKPDTNTDSSEHSHPSVSPISAPSSSLTEWEDKFVVNMPTAKEPNPPIMSTQQISDFQQSIEKVHKEGGAMLDPDTLPSPRTRTPEESTSNPPGQEKTVTGLDGQDSRVGRPTEVSDSNCSSGHRRYYSPEEVGKQRFSTIWEEASAKSVNKTPAANPDGSFLGCKEINGPYDKNPDEILLFSMTDERPKMIDIPSGRSRMSKERKRVTSNHATSTSPEKAVVQEEWKPISQNLKQAQCSKPLPKTMCQEAKCRPPDKTEVSAKASMMENLDPSETTAKQHDKQKLGRKSDDVFIITPTITRTMVTMADLRSSPKKDAHDPTSRAAGEIISDSRVKQTMSSSASGLRRATQNSWEKSNVPCAISSAAAPPTNPHPSPKSHTEADRTSPQKPRLIRGFIRTQGLPKSKTANPGEPARDYQPRSYIASVSPKRDKTHSLKSASDTTLVEKPSTPEAISPTASISKDWVRQDSISQEAGPIEVAELDGQQVSDTAKELFYSKITDFNTDLHSNGLPTNDKEAPSQEMVGYVRDALIELTGQLQGLYDEIMANRHSRAMLVKITFNNVLKMIEHCLHVLKDLLGILALYNTTGSWPKPSREEFARSLIDLCKAMVYLITLGFVMMVIGRAAGYMVLVGSWIVWFARPFAWLLGALGRALLI
ncbi:hypothetical protein ASPBRDRAFT_192571 [Aspergillus brasiliensis CBS 101740]|uniref:NTP binding protein n=1 Tax=Aspergillus brasiliensis (strain CBS 101740 / IMI 381727 / IBT 21946) TaxID=767769 RepID=A0A1L9UXT4_ASPBC|nr:hypothetical protein ASPBRDRAFT_192571 [Aspergillus brasiliensis CBS 101740]